MTDTPEIVFDNSEYSGFFMGIDVLFAGYAEVKFVIRDDSERDLLVIRQQLPDNGYTLHKAVSVARDFVAETLEEVAKDIRTGARPVVPIELTEEELEEFLNEKDE